MDETRRLSAPRRAIGPVTSRSAWENACCMKTTLKQLMGWMVAGAGLSPGLDAAVVSTFDTDADGWYTRDLVGLATAPPGATSSVTWEPAGVIQTTDTLD